MTIDLWKWQGFFEIVIVLLSHCFLNWIIECESLEFICTQKSIFIWILTVTPCKIYFRWLLLFWRHSLQSSRHQKNLERTRLVLFLMKRTPDKTRVQYAIFYVQGDGAVLAFSPPSEWMFHKFSPKSIHLSGFWLNLLKFQ